MPRPLVVFTASITLAAAGACAGRQTGGAASAPSAAPVEAISLRGDTLRAPALPADVRAAYERQLADARAEAARRPGDVEAAIWVGRRTAYLGRYREAIDVFSAAIAEHPGDARLYRHRGHRYITVRELDRAIADFEKAGQLVAGRPDEVEPDGLPNDRNIPTSTLQSNIWYHLGLAHYLKGDFERALPVYRQAMAVSTNPDMQVATAHWLYMTLRRLGQEEEAAAVLAPIRPDMEIIENGSYHRLLLMYKGALHPDSLLAQAPGADAALDDATVGYGVGNWHLYNGRGAEADRLFRRVLAGGPWGAFGYIAAEAELSRGGGRTGGAP
jgi:tetratricopeptide (TPR) repeat protein